MIEPSIPADEKERVQALHDFDVVNTGPEKEYDDIVTLAAQICDLDTAHVSLIDSEKQWLKARIGLGVQNLDRKLAFCAHTILGDDVFIVPDASKDERFFDHPMVMEGLRFYAGMPLTTSDGYNIGSLCVIDETPRMLSEDQITALRILSKQVIKQLELRKANKILSIQSKSLQEKNETNRKLLFIIGHDVRGPLASLKGLVDLLNMGSVSASELQTVAANITGTLVSADSLLNDLLQWAAVQQESGSEKELLDLKALTQSVLESYSLEFVRKKNKIENRIPAGSTITFDKNIFSFVMRNLVLNANKFTDGGSISIDFIKDKDRSRVCINDTGLGMHADQISELFDWKKRNSTAGTQGEKGSGLALLLTSDLLKKNGSDLLIESTKGKGSTFSIVLPLL